MGGHNCAGFTGTASELMVVEALPAIVASCVEEQAIEDPSPLCSRGSCSPCFEAAMLT